MVTRRIFGRSICRYTLLVHHVILLVTLTTIQQVKSESHPEKYSCESNTEFRSHLQWIPQLIQENRYFKIEVTDCLQFAPWS